MEAGRSGAASLIASATDSAFPGRFAGVLKIVRFNVQFYAASTLGILVAAVLIASRLLPRPIELIVVCGTAAIAFWTLSSLLVSWYVYDYVGVTRWDWMPGHVAPRAARWANIHAGLDESTSSLRKLFPGTQGVIVDIYDATEMTEPSIARARRMYPATEPFVTGKFDALPFPDSDRDLVFLLFAAHELRAAEHRTRLLRETARVLHRDGQAVLVEHLRDRANLIAFGPGFLHFHSERSWQRSINDAGLRIAQDFPITPFVRCFLLRRGSDCPDDH
jgi:SAM-dependent methyltransferase